MSNSGWLPAIFGRGRQEQNLPVLGGTANNLPAPVTVRELRRQEREAAKAAAERPQLLFAVDATISRSAAWKSAKLLQDSFFAALPGQCEMALAVHSASRIVTFTEFTTNIGSLREAAAKVECEAGSTRLLPILEKALDKAKRLKAVAYFGDDFEESISHARRLADALLRNETRVFVLYDSYGQSWSDRPPPPAFNELAECTGGAVLPFEASAIQEMRELIEAIVVLTVIGIDEFIAQQETLRGATLLLEYMPNQKLIGRG